MLKVKDPGKVKRNMKIALFAVLLSVPFFATARVFINIKYIDLKTGYTTGASLLPYIHFALAALAALLMLVLCKAFELHYLTKDFDPAKGDYTPTNISPYSEIIYNKTSATVVFMSAFLGFAMISSFFLLTFNLFNKSKEISNLFIMTLVILFSALAGMFFIVSATQNPSPYRKYYACLSFMPVLWGCLRLIMCFMDTTQYINVTSRLFELLCLIAITLFFLAQSRFTLPNYIYHKVGFLFAIGLASIILISVSSIPSVITVAFFPYMGDFGSENNIIFWIIEIIIMFYIISRLFRILTQIDKVTQEDLADYARGYTKNNLKSTIKNAKK